MQEHPQSKQVPSKLNNAYKVSEYFYVLQKKSRTPENPEIRDKGRRRK